MAQVQGLLLDGLHGVVEYLVAHVVLRRCLMNILIIQRTLQQHVVLATTHRRQLRLLGRLLGSCGYLSDQRQIVKSIRLSLLFVSFACVLLGR